MALHPPYEEKYGPCGNFEYYASGEGIARSARELLDEMTDYHGPLRAIEPAELSAQHVVALYEAADAVAVAALSRAIELWGMATANLVSLFNPERIIFGGGVFGPAVGLLDDIGREARKWAQPISMTQVTLVASSLGGAAGLYGAGYFARLAALTPEQ
jgi:glucokinase